MRTKTTATFLSLLALGLFATLQVSHAQNRHDMDDTNVKDTDFSAADGDVTMEAGGLISANNAFGNKVAGTYLGNQSIPGGPAITGQELQTLNAGGTMTATNTSAFNGGNFQGPAAGAWKKTGPAQITINAVIQIFCDGISGCPDNVNDPILPLGTPYQTARVQVVVDYLDNAFTTADAALTTELFNWPTPGDILTAPDVQLDTPDLVVCGYSNWTKLQVTEDAGEDCTPENDCLDLRFLFDCEDPNE